MIKLSVPITTTTLILSVSVYAQNITFEPNIAGLLPDGSRAADNMAISNQFLRSGVLFGLDNDLDGIPDENAFPYLEKSGGADAITGFNGGAGDDSAGEGLDEQLGQYFLRTSALDASTGRDVLLVSYVNPVDTASGEIWDLDAYYGDNLPYVGNEQWRIEALDETQNVITNILTPEGVDALDEESLDALPWSFEISTENKDQISAIRFIFAGTRNNGVGLAFNNFSPAEGLGTTNIIGVAKVHPAMEISWHSQVGKRYQLQWSGGLGDQWHDLDAPVPGTGAEITVLDSTRRAGNRMYRVLEVD